MSIIPEPDLSIPAGKTAILSHSDEVSGITVLKDGTRLYWTEGRSSNVVVKALDGRSWEFAPGWDDLDARDRKVWDEELAIEAEGADIYRTMTPAEEAEWAAARK